MASFVCDSCGVDIPPFAPRVHCQTCPDYDACAACALGERWVGLHNASHATQLFKTSGDGSVRPVLSQTTSITHVALTQRVPPPMPPRRPASVAYPAVSMSPPVSSASPSTPTGWQPFFNEDMTPSPTFVLFMTKVFIYLDPSRTGFLAPHVYSKFLDDMGYVGQENVWKHNLIQPAPMGQSHEDFADYSLKRAFDLFSIEHALEPRVQSSSAAQDANPLAAIYQSVLGLAYDPNTMGQSSIRSSGMPLLTLKGFIDITSVETLSDPSREWGNLSRVSRKYNFHLNAFAGWGGMPRSALPDYPDPRMMEKIRNATAVSAAQGKRALDASAMRLRLEAQGQQHAMDLVDDRRYYYRYY